MVYKQIVHVKVPKGMEYFKLKIKILDCLVNNILTTLLIFHKCFVELRTKIVSNDPRWISVFQLKE